jgi:hypothetical protein
MVQEHQNSARSKIWDASKRQLKKAVARAEKEAHWYYELTNTPVSTIQARRVKLQ